MGDRAQALSQACFLRSQNSGKRVEWIWKRKERKYRKIWPAGRWINQADIGPAKEACRQLGAGARCAPARGCQECTAATEQGWPTCRQASLQGPPGSCARLARVPTPCSPSVFQLPTFRVIPRVPCRMEDRGDRAGTKRPGALQSLKPPSRQATGLSLSPFVRGVCREVRGTCTQVIVQAATAWHWLCLQVSCLVES